MFKVNNKDTRMTPMAKRHSCRSGVFIVNFEHISHFFLVFLLLTFFLLTFIIHQTKNTISIALYLNISDQIGEKWKL